MNQYTSLRSGMSTHEATMLSARLSAWHDAMVMHERRLRLGTPGVTCHDECPHAEARILWAEALATFGEGRGAQLFAPRGDVRRRTTGSPIIQGYTCTGSPSANARSSALHRLRLSSTVGALVRRLCIGHDGMRNDGAARHPGRIWAAR